MKVIETDSFGNHTGWQHGPNKMYLEKFNGGKFYFVEKLFKKNKSGTENFSVCETFLKFKDAKKCLMK